ncbi:MAG TPA: protoheme IX farnesyltransferase [Planctomycetes bacterium]|nr:protoheme IX farnesyltransferase [Planctomycetota bacterium]
MNSDARWMARLAPDRERPLGALLAMPLAWLELTKPRIGLFVVFAAFTGGLLAAGPDADLGRLLLAALLVGAVGSSSSVFNQILERDLDRRMERTSARPLVVGTITPRDAVLFAALLGFGGTIGLALWFNVLSALLGLSTLVAYALVYTPLKRATSLNTVVGALPGAMPPILGAVAMVGHPGPWGWILFAILFAWQFPHFLAIAWLYREDYARAGMKMLPALPGSAGMAGRQALLYSLLLLPISVLPGARGDAGIVFTALALGLGLAYCAASAAFAWRESRSTARLVLLVSLIYLPLVLTGALVDPVVSSVLGN